MDWRFDGDWLAIFSASLATRPPVLWQMKMIGRLLIYQALASHTIQEKWPETCTVDCLWSCSCVKSLCANFSRSSSGLSFPWSASKTRARGRCVASSATGHGVSEFSSNQARIGSAPMAGTATTLNEHP